MSVIFPIFLKLKETYKNFSFYKLVDSGSLQCHRLIYPNPLALISIFCHNKQCSQFKTKHFFLFSFSFYLLNSRYVFSIFVFLTMSTAECGSTEKYILFQFTVKLDLHSLFTQFDRLHISAVNCWTRTALQCIYASYGDVLM